MHFEKVSPFALHAASLLTLAKQEGQLTSEYLMQGASNEGVRKPDSSNPGLQGHSDAYMAVHPSPHAPRPCAVQ